jgi:hypothetical protein
MQPWAWLIVRRLKPIENRTWSTRFRGPVLIHAGLKIDRDAEADLRAGRHPVTGEPFAVELPAEFERGGIVGHGRIVGCVAHSDSEWFVGDFGFLVADAGPLPLVPCRGALGFFRPQFGTAPPSAPPPQPLDLFSALAPPR